VGRLVKSGGRLVPREVMSAREQAAHILAAAEAEAASRRRDLAELEQQARQTGFAEGHAAGREAALAEATELLARARAEAEQVLRASQEAAAVLARRMAEKIVGRTLELHPMLLADIAAQALAASRARSGPVTLRVHPEDLAVLESERPRLCARLSDALDLRLLADQTVERHGCIVETPLGRLDARLSAQLDALERALETSNIPLSRPTR
jgi:type III secretion protein L